MCKTGVADCSAPLEDRLKNVSHHQVSCEHMVINHIYVIVCDYAPDSFFTDSIWLTAISDKWNYVELSQ